MHGLHVVCRRRHHNAKALVIEQALVGTQGDHRLSIAVGVGRMTGLVVGLARMTGLVVGRTGHHLAHQRVVGAQDADNVNRIVLEEPWHRVADLRLAIVVDFVQKKEATIRFPALQQIGLAFFVLSRVERAEVVAALELDQHPTVTG